MAELSFEETRSAIRDAARHVPVLKERNVNLKLNKQIRVRV